MKVFIVSMAMVIMGVSALVFSADMSAYDRLDRGLEAITESCAACGALSFDELENAQDGSIVFDEAYVMDCMKDFLRSASFSMPCFLGGRLYIDEDSLHSFCDDVSETKSVTVTVVYRSDRDMFRLPFLSCRRISHSSCYEWVPDPSSL